MRVTPLLAGTALLATLATGARAADTFDLSTPNSALSGFNGPYAQVSVNLTSSTTATVTFTSLTSGGNIYLMGDGGTVGVNVNAASWTVSGLTSSNSGTGFSASQIAPDSSPGNEDGFGSFNQTFTSFDGFTHSSSSVSFTLTNTSGTWSSANNVLVDNSGMAEAAAHIFVTSSPANASNSALVTGFAAGNDAGDTPPPVPEPASIAILGVGLLGIGMVVHRRRNG